MSVVSQPSVQHFYRVPEKLVTRFDAAASFYASLAIISQHLDRFELAFKQNHDKIGDEDIELLIEWAEKVDTQLCGLPNLVNGTLDPKNVIVVPPFNAISGTPLYHLQEASKVLVSVVYPASQIKKTVPACEFERVYRTAFKMQEGDLPSFLPSLEKVGRMLHELDANIGKLSDPEAKDIGKKLLEAEVRTGGILAVKPNLNCQASFFGYDLNPFNPPNANLLAFNPWRISNFPMFSSSYMHEKFHMYQMVAPVLQHSLYNRETKEVLHPLDIIRTVLLTEADAGAKTAWVNYLRAEKESDMIFATNSDLVSVEKFAQIRQRSATLGDTMVEAARASMHKPFSTKDGADRSITFEHYYIDVALDSIELGLKFRKNNGQMDFKYVQATNEQLHAIGAHDTGPNALGAKRIDPILAAMPHFLPHQKQRLEKICAEYNIPLHEDCPVLQTKQKSFTSAPEQILINTAKPEPLYT